jgi:hypothetical protein
MPPLPLFLLPPHHCLCFWCCCHPPHQPLLQRSSNLQVSWHQGMAVTAITMVKLIGEQEVYLRKYYLF